MSTPLPNILVIMADQMSAQASSLYGNPLVPTPSLERLATGGVVYDCAYTPCPLCVPARIATWTACHPSRTGCQTNQDSFPENRPNPFSLWRDMGYRTALIGKDHCFTAAQKQAFDEAFEVEHYGVPESAEAWQRDPDRARAVHAANTMRRNMPATDAPYPHATTDHPEEHYATPAIAACTAEFIATSDRPFAAWVSFPDPHPPFEVARRWFDEARIDLSDLPKERPVDWGQMPERLRILHGMLAWPADAQEDLAICVSIYFAMIRQVDHYLGRILDALEDTGQADNTIVVFCADHGDFGGNFGMMSKGGGFPDCLARVPLVVRAPGILPAGTRAQQPVSLVDILPFLLSAQGTDPSILGAVDGLAEALIQPFRTSVVSEYGAGGPLYRFEDYANDGAPAGIEAIKKTLLRREAEGERAMVRFGRFKFIDDPMGDLDELYDLETDPAETTNLAGKPEHRETRDIGRTHLKAWRRRNR
ncbi:choline-sulfatase [Aliiruegeria haliotis]|uniref:Choline-sulfatase n=1 Tax=Aliiruegeria haliotis TaxID=1280846 RepID=A0A2T0RLW7_9RHOB|nr:sulfatase-like hydrolase/transferase [Aliiruegeria haliotis]PRY22184.1 choline-sulfatase [Aliiruegeria haliotis]